MNRPGFGATIPSPEWWQEEQGFLLDQGFREVDRAFFNYHPSPPALLGDGDTGRIVNPDQIAELPEWRQMLQCSTYFTLSLRQ